MKYKKEVRPKISHFWSPKESSYGWDRRREKGRREKKKNKKKRPRKVWNCMEAIILYGLLVLYGLLKVFMDFDLF